LLSYFRLNDPLRLFVTYFIILVIRIPYYLSDWVPNGQNIRFFILGEKVGNGNWLFNEIYTTMGPLEGWLYAVLFVIFGKSLFIHHLLSFLLICFQSYLFNKVFNDNKATTEQTYIPGLIYGLLMSLSPQFYILSPLLVGQTLILVALNILFNHLEFRIKRDEGILSVGIIMGIYSLMFFPGVILAVFALIILLIFTNTAYRRYILLIFGFLIPFLLVLGIYIFFNEFEEMNFMQGSLFGENIFPIVSFKLYLVAFLPAFFFVIAIFAIIARGRYTNFQSTLIQTMFFWLIGSVIAYFANVDYGIDALILLIIPFAFFLSHYFILLGRKSSGEAIFIFFFIVAIAVNVVQWNTPEVLKAYLDDESERTDMNIAIPEGSKILFLGPGYEIYHKMTHGSNFLDWKLSKEILESPNNISSIESVFVGIKDDYPDFIIDPNDYLKHFLSRIPELDQKYELLPEGKVYKRVN